MPVAGFVKDQWACLSRQIELERVNDTCCETVLTPCWCGGDGRRDGDGDEVSHTSEVAVCRCSSARTTGAGQSHGRGTTGDSGDGPLEGKMNGRNCLYYFRCSNTFSRVINSHYDLGYCISLWAGYSNAATYFIIWLLKGSYYAFLTFSTLFSVAVEKGLQSY